MPMPPQRAAGRPRARRALGSREVVPEVAGFEASEDSGRSTLQDASGCEGPEEPASEVGVDPCESGPSRGPQEPASEVGVDPSGDGLSRAPRASSSMPPAEHAWAGNAARVPEVARDATFERPPEAASVPTLPKPTLPTRTLPTEVVPPGRKPEVLLAPRLF